MKTFILHKGKTKTIRSHPSDVVQVHFSDNVTAGDGASLIQVPGKGALSCAIAANCFRLLHKQGVRTTFIEVTGRDSFGAFYANPAPLEVVCRGIGTGSYLKRNLSAKEGDVFETPVTELFLKDDARHDPLIIPIDNIGGMYMLHKPDMPVSDSGSELGVLDFKSDDRWWHMWSPAPVSHGQIHTLFCEAETLVLSVYLILAEAWAKLGYTLVDLKIEVGVCPMTGKVIVIDAITPDEWRLWKGGDKAQAFDKDPFRKSQEKDGEAIKQLLFDRYNTIAALTSRF